MRQDPEDQNAYFGGTRAFAGRSARAAKMHSLKFKGGMASRVDSLYRLLSSWKEKF